MSRDDSDLQRNLELAGTGEDDALVSQARVDKFAAALRHLREDPGEAARIDRIIGRTDGSDTGAEAQKEFGDFYAATHMTLLQFARTSGADLGEAEDAVHETLVHLYGRWKQIDDPRAYALTVIRVVLRNMRRRSPRRFDRTSAEDQVEAAVLARDQRARQILYVLPSQQRQIVADVAAGKSTSEIAQSLGVTRAAVHKALRMARKRLDEVVDESELW